MNYFMRIIDVLGDDQCRTAVHRLLQNGKNDTARSFLLSRIDGAYISGKISFIEAAGFYNLLDVSLERVGQFPQKHLGMF